jgi:hypothetical protein
MQGWNNDQSKSKEKSNPLTHYSFIGSRPVLDDKPKPINTDKGMEKMLKSGINPLLDESVEEEVKELRRSSRTFNME